MAKKKPKKYNPRKITVRIPIPPNKVIKSNKDYDKKDKNWKDDYDYSFDRVIYREYGND